MHRDSSRNTCAAITNRARNKYPPKYARPRSSTGNSIRGRRGSNRGKGERERDFEPAFEQKFEFVACGACVEAARPGSVAEASGAGGPMQAIVSEKELEARRSGGEEWRRQRDGQSEEEERERERWRNGEGGRGCGAERDKRR